MTEINVSEHRRSLPSGILPWLAWWSRFAHVYTVLSAIAAYRLLFSSKSHVRFFVFPSSLSFAFFSPLHRRFHFRVLQPINPLRFFLRESKTWLRGMYQVTSRSSSIISYRARASFSFYFVWRLHIHYPPLHLHAFPQRSQKDKPKLYIIIRWITQYFIRKVVSRFAHFFFLILYSELIFYSLCNLVNLSGAFPLLLPFYAWKAVLTIFLLDRLLPIDEGVPFERLGLLRDDVRF